MGVRFFVAAAVGIDVAVNGAFVGGIDDTTVGTMTNSVSDSVIVGVIVLSFCDCPNLSNAKNAKAAINARAATYAIRRTSGLLVGGSTGVGIGGGGLVVSLGAVSYTHLTLPTNREV